MEFKELLEKYQALLAENNNLKQEIKNLRAQMGIVEQQIVPEEISEYKPEILIQQSAVKGLSSNINNKSSSAEKIKLFMSLFKGRDDVYAKRWENKKKRTSGYFPEFCCTTIIPTSIKYFSISISW